MLFCRSALVCAVLLAFGQPAAAQAPDTLAAAMVRSDRDLPVLRPTESIKTPARAAATMNAADLLRLFTGVQVKDYGGAGGLKTVNVRSLGSEHVGIFIDGIQIDNAQNMQVDLGRISSMEADQLSLYEGQLSQRLLTAAEYTSGVSVHLDTAVPERDELNISVRGGSMGTVNPSLGWKKRFGKSALVTSLEYLGSNGRYPYQYFDTTLVRENGDIRSARLDTRLYGRLSRGDWRVLVHAYGSERGFPGPVVRRALGFPLSAERQSDGEMYLQGAWKQEWTDAYASAVRFKYADSYTHYSTHPEKNPMAVPYDLHYRQRSVYASVAQSITFTPCWSADLSSDYQWNSLDSDAGAFVQPRRSVLTGALATRVILDKFRIAGHMAFQWAQDTFANPQAGGWSRDDIRHCKWMPSLSFAWEPLGWLELDCFVKRSYRLPSFNDLYYTLIGNASLRPESAFQLGSDLRLHEGGPAFKWEVRLSPYYNRVSDKIVAIPTASQFRWTMLNIGVADISGLDCKVESRLSQGDWNIGCVLRYSFQSAIDHSTPGSLTYGNQIPYIPLHSGSAGLDVGFRDWSLVWDTLVTGGRWSRTANTADYYIAPWSLSDVVLARRFSLWEGRGQLTVSLRCSNIFNARYQVVQGYPMPGRAAYASVSLSL